MPSDARPAGPTRLRLAGRVQNSFREAPTSIATTDASHGRHRPGDALKRCSSPEAPVNWGKPSSSYRAAIIMCNEGLGAAASWRESRPPRHRLAGGLARCGPSPSGSGRSSARSSARASRLRNSGSEKGAMGRRGTFGRRSPRKPPAAASSSAAHTSYLPATTTRSVSSTRSPEASRRSRATRRASDMEERRAQIPTFF
jgi:hypothetical protein